MNLLPIPQSTVLYIYIYGRSGDFKCLKLLWFKVPTARKYDKSLGYQLES